MRITCLPVLDDLVVPTHWKTSQIRIQQKILGTNIYKLDLRLWHQDEKTGEFFPSRKGFCFDNDMWRNNVMPEMTKMLDKYNILYDYSGRYKIE